MWQGNQIKHVWQILGLKGAAATEWGLPEILSGQNLLNYKNQYHGAKTRTRNPNVPGFVITSQDLLASCAASVGLIFLIIRWNTRQKYPFSPHFLPALNSRTSYFIPTSRFLKISYMFIWILPFPAIMLVVQHLSLCNLNGHMRIQLPHLIRREILNLLKMTRYSFQRLFYLCFSQTWLPGKCRVKSVKLLLSPSVIFSFSQGGPEKDKTPSVPQN